MVSLQYYLKRFYFAIPERIALIERLKAEKAKFDKVMDITLYDTPRFAARIMRDPDYYQYTIDKIKNEIQNQITIIGRDTFFRKAESIEKYTLRHMTWKFIKSINNLEKEYSKLTKYIGYVNTSNKDIEDMGWFMISTSNSLNDLLWKMDEIYVKEVAALEKMFNYFEGPKHDQFDGDSERDPIDRYLKIVEEEKMINKNIETIFVKIFLRFTSYKDLIKQYYNILKSKKIMRKEVTFHVAEVLCLGIGIYIMITSAYSLLDYKSLKEFGIEVNRLLEFGKYLIGIGALTSSIVIFNKSELPNLVIKLIKKALI